MSYPSARLLSRRVLGLFIGIYIFGLFLMMSNNIFGFGQSIESLLGFWLLQMLGLGLLFVGPGVWVSLWLLRPLRQWLKVGAQDKVDLAGEARRAVFRYPWQGIIFFAAFGVLGSGLFHLTQALHDYGDIMAVPGWWEVTSRIYLEEFSLSVALGIVFFVVARRALRPFLIVLPAPDESDTRRFSVRVRFAVTLAALMVHNSMTLLAVYLNGLYFHEIISGARLVVLSSQSLVVSIGIGLMAASDLSSDLNQITKGLAALTLSDRVGLRQRLPITSDDETGDLVLAFNALQSRAEALAQDMEREFELARRIQAELLPSPSVLDQIKGWHITGFSLPAHAVGGDFYDLLDLGDGQVGIAIGDATGKGVPAAMLMAATMGFIRSEAYRGGQPRQVVTRLNQLVAATTPRGFFVTLLYMVIDTRSGRTTFSSAGHLDPLLLRPGENHAEYLPVSSLPLGIDPDLVYEQQEVLIEPGSRLVLYTDGTIDIPDGSQSIWGFLGFSRHVERICRQSSGVALVTGLRDEISRRIGSTTPGDDLTVVVVEMPEEQV